MNAALSRNGLRILMVDDTEEDIFFVKRALEKSGVGKAFAAVHDGDEAVRYLQGEGIYGNRNEFPFPNLILSDLKMPRMDGYAVLGWLRSHPECSVIPAIIFSSSAIPSDIQQAYLAGANAYIVKPTNFDELVDLIQITHRFWSQCQTPASPLTEKCA